MKTKDILKRLQAVRIVSSSSDESKALIEYKIVLSVKEFEDMEREAKNANTELHDKNRRSKNGR
jgi:hypothetical protein